MSKLGGPNDALLVELITRNAKPPVPSRQPGPPGHDSPCRTPLDGVRDTTLRPPGVLRRAEARWVRAYAAVVAVAVLGVGAEQVIRW